jgi:hypothetical protein|tara:strand:- start:64 stop:900 length:837 start_codon:yes stop_codon:yes gene_type:complete
MATYESKKYASIPIAATQVADGSVTNAEFQFINTVSSNVQTQVDAKAATAGATFTGAVRINDSQNLLIGSGTDLVISHDTNNSKINNTTGELRIAGDTIKLMNQAEDETHVTATADGAVGLRHNNVEKLATSATGVTVSGTVAATAVTGDGSGLTGMADVTSGTAIGALRYFTLFSKDSNTPTNTDIDIGADITVATYESGNLHLASNFDDFGGMINGQDIGGYGFRLSGGRAITQASNAKAVRTTLAGTWKFIGKCAYRSTNTPDARSQSALAVRIS